MIGHYNSRCTALFQGNGSFLGALSEHVTKSCRYYTQCSRFCRSFGYGACNNTRLLCATCAQEIDGLRCWEPVCNTIIEALMTSKLTLIGIVEFLLSAVSIFREAAFSNGNSPELVPLNDDRKFARTHVYVHVFEVRMYPVHAPTKACHVLVTTVTARYQHSW